jgi:hypothetical protein
MHADSNTVIHRLDFAQESLRHSVLRVSTLAGLDNGD